MKIERKSMKEIRLKTEDNVEIALNHYENGFEDVIIIAPGWFMTKDSKSFKDMSDILSKKSDILVLDFRGHGHSGGFYTFTSKEIKDMDAAVKFASERYKKIYLMGFSLGAAIVLIAGAKNSNIEKIIAVSAPISFEKIENMVWKKEAWIPTLKKFEPKRWFSIRPALPIGKKIKPIEIVDSIKCPTLFIAGEKDPTVCSWHTKTLYDKAICKKRYEIFKDCCHAEDLFLQDKNKFIQLCSDWLFSK